MEREKLRVRFGTEEEYDTFFSRDEVNVLIRDLVTDKFAISLITMLLGKKPHSIRETSDILHFVPAETAP